MEDKKRKRQATKEGGVNAVLSGSPVCRRVPKEQYCRANIIRCHLKFNLLSEDRRVICTPDWKVFESVS
jgi:hypothetical protein